LQPAILLAKIGLFLAKFTQRCKATLRKRLSAAFLHPLAEYLFQITTLDIATLDVWCEKSFISRMDAVTKLDLKIEFF